MTKRPVFTRTEFVSMSCCLTGALLVVATLALWPQGVAAAERAASNVVMFEDMGCETCAASPGAYGCGGGQGNCGGRYFEVRAGAMTQDRSTFFLGKVTEDSNDLTPGFHQTYAEPGFDVGGDGVSLEFVAGRALSCCTKIEGRFGYASLDESGGFAAADLSGFPFQVGSGGFWVPFIDASAPEHARGIFGMRVRNNVNVDFEYDSDWFDFGIDVVRNITHTNYETLDLVVGPAFANIDQRFRHVTTGDWNGPTQTSDVTENLDEWFFGAKFALRGERFITHRLKMVGGLMAFAYYHHADFDGSQFLDTAGALSTTYNVNVEDSRDNFSARLGVEAGLNYDINSCLSIGFLYRLESWHNVASVVNPDLALLEDGGDNRWVGDERAHLVDDQAVNQSIFATIEWHR